MRVYHLLNADNGMSDISLHRIRISRIRDLNDPFEMLAVRADDKELLKVFLAFKYFDVVADEQSVEVENAYWVQMSMPPPYTFSEPSPNPNTV